MSKEKKGSISVSIITMSVLPLLLFGLVVTLFSVGRFTSIINLEVENEMESVAEAIQVMYDYAYPGNYELEGSKVLALYKGESEITGDFEIIDTMKERTGMEISVFYEDIRMLTTICGANGERLVGTGANATVLRDVVDERQSMFYERLNINDKDYFVYYAPLLNRNGNCVGMLGIARAKDDVQKSIWKAVTPTLVLAAISMIIAGWIGLSYARGLSGSIQQLNSSLALVAKGNLLKEMDYGVMKRNDEIGEIGKSIVSMQKALRVLIEQDMLTELYNRRYAQARLKQTVRQAVRNGITYSLAIGDIDFFKRVNDTYGHEAGDEVLKSVARILRTHMLGKGYVARWGGEEFLLVFENYDAYKAADFLEAILSEIRAKYTNYGEDDIQVTMTFGVVNGSADSQLDELLVLADRCLYEGKEAGRDRVVIQKTARTDEAKESSTENEE